MLNLWGLKRTETKLPQAGASSLGPASSFNLANHTSVCTGSPDWKDLGTKTRPRYVRDKAKSCRMQGERLGMATWNIDTSSILKQYAGPQTWKAVFAALQSRPVAALEYEFGSSNKNITGMCRGTRTISRRQDPHTVLRSCLWRNQSTHCANNIAFWAFWDFWIFLLPNFNPGDEMICKRQMRS